MAECEEIYVAASRRIEKAPEQNFGKERVLCTLRTYFILLNIHCIDIAHRSKSFIWSYVIAYVILFISM